MNNESIKIKTISTHERLKELISNMGITQKEFVSVFNKWLKEQHKKGKYTYEPDVLEVHISRWTKPNRNTNKVVKMKRNKIEMFADFFDVDPEYIECKHW